MAIEVVVVGGGIGGLACALALRRAGKRVRVLEKSAEFGEIGAGLQLAPNATRILRSWSLLDEVVARGVLPRRLVLRDALDGTDLTSLDVADVERRYGAPYVVIHRTDLHEILLAACRSAGVELHTSVAVTDVSGGVAISAGRRDVAAVVIAADGLGSTLRQHLSDDEPVDSGFVAYRGTVPIAELSDTALLSLDEMVVYIGPSCHLVQYALRGGAMLNQVAVFRASGGNDLDSAFSFGCAEVRSALPRFWRDRRWAMFDREPIANWVDGRMALAGDAAHPMLQYLAQGACQAIEDAARLGELAAATSDWEEVLAGYNAQRTVRTAQVQRVARQWGELWHCDGLSRSIRNAYLRDRDPKDYRYVDWLYAADVTSATPSVNDSVGASIRPS